MKKRKMNRWLALTVAASLCATGSPQQMVLAEQVSDKLASVESTEEGNVFKVELDESGTIVADNASDLEHQNFSWDNATVYFVLTDRFKNADKSNDHSYGRGMQADGKTPVEGLDTYTNPGTFHGGDLKGLTEKVEDGYFNDLGVNAIWITAPYEQIHGYTSANVKSNNASTYPDPDGQGFPYYSYHGYWTLDYTNIDENMGDEEDFEDFVDSCHEHGIRVVMDVVMNHVGYTTMQDAVDYGFDGALKGDWKTYYYGNSTSLMGGDPESTSYWDKTSSAWANWWGAGFVRADYPGYTAAGGDDTHMSLSGLPDVITESGAAEVKTPPLLVNKWTKEGRAEQEQKELDEFFSSNGYKTQPRYYIIKWLSDWVREYGVDGFRCDTAKHVDLDAWNDLKVVCVDALKEWRKNNPDKPGADWTDDFWMTGECWGHGMGKSPYHTSGGFDSMINFSFPKDGNLASLEGTYKNYADSINSDPEFNALSYVASHDDSAGLGVFSADSTKSKNLGTSLLLAPGGVQIYYGNEVNRQIGWKDFFTGSDYLDQRYRTDMDWSAISSDSATKDVLKHWQLVGQFRNKHLSVGGGQHEMLSESPYTFSRTYHLEEDDEDKVVCSIPGKAGTYDVAVGDIFEDGETITDYYSGEKYQVSGGTVSVTCDANGVILLEGSGIVKASVSAKTKNKSTTYSTDTFEVTLKANKAKETYYQINGGEKKEYTAGDVITIGGDTAYEEETTITLTGISEDDGSELKKEVTYQRSKEPTVSDGVFCVKVKKSDFSTAPNIFIYSNDAAETAYAGAWPGPVMTEDEDSEYWSYSSEDITEDALIILSLGAASNTGGTWRSTPDKAKGLLAKGTMLYDKTANELTELPSGEPGKVTINYVDQDGNELKSIYRVGVIGKKYTTYPAVIDGYTLVEEPDNATGVFEENSEVTYVYAQGGGVAKTPKPEVTSTPKPDDDKNKNTEAPATEKPTETQKVDETKEPTETKTPSTGTPKPTSTATTNTLKPTSTVKPTNSPVATGGTVSNGGIASDNSNENKTNAEELAVTITTNKSSAQTVKTPITINAKATGGSGTYNYLIYVTNASTKKVTQLQNFYSSNSKVVWKPTTAGTYKITVTAKDTADGKTVSGNLSFKITKTKFTYNSFTVKAVGKKIKMSASVTPGSGSIKYKYVIRQGNKMVKNYGYSRKGTRSYKVKKAGIYKVTMYAKDKIATVYVTKKIKVK